MQLSSFALRVKEESGFDLTSAPHVCGTHLHTNLFERRRKIRHQPVLSSANTCLPFVLEAKVRGLVLVVQLHQFLQGCLSSTPCWIFSSMVFLVQSQEQSLC